MKLIKASYQILEPQETIFKDIELAARTCYKSEDKITNDSANRMVEMLIKNKHTAMLEHGTVYLKWKNDGSVAFSTTKCCQFSANKYSVVTSANGYDYITTNYRVLIEKDWLHYLHYQCEPTEYHEKRISVKFICDRGVSHEFVRHRVFSFAQESTRYCNYSKDKFGNELTFIIPSWFAGEKQIDMSLEKRDLMGKNHQELLWKRSMCDAENMYLSLLEGNWTPQQARSVLPNSLKTELVMTGFIKDWKGFFSLRTPITAHPQARELAQPLFEEFLSTGLIK